MKTYLISPALPALFICLAVAGTGLAQQLGPVPPAEGLPIQYQVSLLQKRLRQPPPPQPGGFWVVEDQPGARTPAIVRYYTDQRQLLQADTLLNTRLDIRRRAVVNRLNERLIQLLDTQPTDNLAISPVKQ